MDDGEPPPNPASNTVVLPSNTDEIDLELEEDGEPTTSAVVAPGQGLDGVKVSTDTTAEPAAGPASSNVPEDLRAQLPASFAKPPPQPAAPQQQPMSHPPDIKNTKTHFLALDKCLPNRDFLQLLSMPAVSSPDATLTRPLHLSYDKEWLAITRVFATELHLGGDPNTRAPPDKGETYYTPLISAQETWIEEHITDFTIPQNFEITAPVYDHVMGIRMTEQPREYSNNQTSRFCQMLEIPNLFDIGEEERERRMRVGPRPDEVRRDGGGRGGFGRGRGRGGGGRGGFQPGEVVGDL